ncbi:MAG: hypothetical protein V4598_20015 [Bdellovibrionota bacterium]
MKTIRFLILGLLLNLSAFAGSLPYELTVKDPDNLLGAERELVLANLDAAVDDWGKWITGKAPLRIEMRVTNDTASGRFGGSTTTLKFDKDVDGYKLFEPSSVYRLRTGKIVPGSTSDVLILVNVDFMKRTYWMDPEPKLRTKPVPVGKVDLVTVFAHELGHGLGMNALLNFSTGLPRESKGVTAYDRFILDTAALGDSNVYFSGPMAKKAYEGKSVPIFFVTGSQQENIVHNEKTYLCMRDESQNLAHYGHFNSASPENDLTFFGLMAGAWVAKDPKFGIRTFVGRLDAAILGDIGVPLL